MSNQKMREAAGWQPIGTAPHQKAVLIHYKNSHGNSRVIKAKFVPRYTVESDGENDSYDEYCDEKDALFLREGWYELIDNWGDFSSVHVYEGVPDMWHPLPVIDEVKRSQPTEAVELTDSECLTALHAGTCEMLREDNHIPLDIFLQSSSATSLLAGCRAVIATHEAKRSQS